MNHNAINSALDFLPSTPKSNGGTVLAKLARGFRALADGIRDGLDAHATYLRLRAAGATEQVAARNALERMR